MKFIKKINRGVILTALVLIGVIIYLVVFESYQGKIKTKLQEQYNQFISVYSECLVIPEKYYKDGYKVTEADVDTVTKDTMSKISEYISQDDEDKAIIEENIRSNVSSLLFSKANRIESIKKENIPSLTIFDIEKKFAYCTFTSDISCTLYDNKLKQSTSMYAQQSIDTVHFSKNENDEWKIIYIDLNYSLDMITGTMMNSGG